MTTRAAAWLAPIDSNNFPNGKQLGQFRTRYMHRENDVESMVYLRCTSLDVPS
jgi:hypothetical protein